MTTPTPTPAPEPHLLPITSDELWAIRQAVLGAGMGDPWDGEELENGYVRPIPKGFEDEVEKFDKMHSQQIKDINACLDKISDVALRLQQWEQSARHAPRPPDLAKVREALRAVLAIHKPTDPVEVSAYENLVDEVLTAIAPFLSASGGKEGK